MKSRKKPVSINPTDPPGAPEPDPDPLTPSEKARFKKSIAIVRAGIRKAEALLEIKRKALWRGTHSSWEAYFQDLCDKQGLSRRDAEFEKLAFDIFESEKRGPDADGADRVAAE